ncbi:UNVERIFIED_CONTAM: Structural maintenance of chromosomes protein 6 [Siphonaria sp. JEL0065]|nr:Structural maintenance of chromosomes protein 6 [Siphonaria sp. JEL0065]
MHTVTAPATPENDHDHDPPSLSQEDAAAEIESFYSTNQTLKRKSGFDFEVSDESEKDKDNSKETKKRRVQQPPESVRVFESHFDSAVDLSSVASEAPPPPSSPVRKQVPKSLSASRVSSRVSSPFRAQWRTDVEKLSANAVLNLPPLAGILKKIELYQFMCHSMLEIELGPDINFIIGHNGSGKSAILTAIIVCLGGKARATDRGDALKTLVMEGKHTAEIIVTIENQGPESFQPEIYGQTISIQRRITRDGSGSFALIDAVGVVQSRAREDVLAMCDHFSISIDNPLSVLTQEKARLFLGGSSAAERYEFFANGTMLTSIYENGQDILKASEEAKLKFENRINNLPYIEKEYEEARDRLQTVQNQSNLEADIHDLKQELAWALVNEDREKVQEKTRELDRANAKIAELNAAITPFSEIIHTKQETAALIQSHITNIANHLVPLQDRIKATAHQLSTLQDTLSERLEAIRKTESERDHAKQALETLEQRVAEETRKLMGADRDAREMKLREIQALEHDKENRIARVTQLTDQIETTDIERDLIVEKKRELVEQLEELERKMKEEARVMEGLKQSKDDRISAYGQFMANARREVEAVSAAKGWQGHAPIGPIGLSISLLRPEFRRVIEATLGSLLKSFIVNTLADREKLNEILRKHRCFASIYVHDGLEIENRRDFQTSQPSPEIMTVYRAMKIDNPIVMRQLVINRHIEKMALVMTKHDGDRLATAGPNQTAAPHVSYIYTVDNIQIGGYGGGLQTRAGNNTRDDRLLAADINSEIRERETVIAGYNREKRVLNNRIGDLESDLIQINSKIDTLKSQKQRASRDVNEFTNEIKRLQDELLEGDSTQIDYYEKNRQEADLAHELFQSQLSTLNQEIIQLQAQVAVLGNTLNDLTVEFNSLKESQALKMASLNELLSETNRIAQEQSMIIARKTQLVNQAAKVQDDLEGLQLSLELAIQKAHEFSDGHHMNDARCASISVLESEILRLETTLKENRIHLGSKEAALQAFTEKKQLLQDVQQDIAGIEQILAALHEAHQLRTKAWQQLRTSVSLRAKKDFTMMMNKQGFHAKMVIDHEAFPKPTLELSVDVHNASLKAGIQGSRAAAAAVAASNNGNSKDVNSLSGGEKSFSTDAVNRKMTMESLINHARIMKDKCRQFIFITPQGLGASDLTSGPDVRISRMPDPDRNRHLNLEQT